MMSEYCPIGDSILSPPKLANVKINNRYLHAVVLHQLYIEYAKVYCSFFKVQGGPDNEMKDRVLMATPHP